MGLAAVKFGAGHPAQQEVHPALKTPTDLSPDSVAAVVAALNPLIADGLALYVKTKNFHWHLSGSRFRDLHLLFDEQADQILDGADPLAERVRKLGGTTIRSVSHVTSIQTIQDNNQPFVTPVDMLTELLNDNRSVVRNMRAAHMACEEAGDCATASLLEIYLDEAERRIWFLFEAAQGAGQA